MPDKGRTGAVRRPAGIDVAAVLAATAVSTALTLLASIIVARSFGPAGKGVITIVLLTVAQSAAVLSFGVDVALVHFAGRQRSPIATLARAGLHLAFLLGGAAALAGILLVHLILAPSVGRPVLIAASFVMVTIPVSLAAAYWQSLLRAQGRIVEDAFLATLQSIARFASVIGAVAVAWGLTGMLVFHGLGALAAAAAALALALRWGIIPRRDENIRGVERALVRYGLRGHLGTVLQGLNYRLDAFIVAFLMSPKDVGLYSVAVGASEMLWIIPNTLGILLMQRAATSDADHANLVTALATRVTSTGLVILSVFLAFTAGRVVVGLYGPAFAPSVHVLLLLLPGVWALGIWKNLMNDLAGRGFPQYKSSTAALAVLVTVVLDILLIPPLGIAGAALASTAAYIMATLASLVAYERITGTRTVHLLLPRRGDAVVLKNTILESVRYPGWSLARQRRRRGGEHH